MAVARATLRTDIWDTLYTYLTSTNPITVATSNVLSAFNSGLVKDKGYPLVIISPPLVSKVNQTLKGNFKEAGAIVNFDIYDDTAQGVKSIVDNLSDKLDDGASVLFNARLKLENQESGDYSTWEEGKKKIHRITIPVTFRWVGK